MLKNLFQNFYKFAETFVQNFNVFLKLLKKFETISGNYWKFKHFYQYFLHSIFFETLWNFEFNFLQICENLKSLQNLTNLIFKKRFFQKFKEFWRRISQNVWRKVSAENFGKFLRKIPQKRIWKVLNFNRYKTLQFQIL